jgi:ornithine cyclodeaminase/alanine dehydrogenase-like protein (mu-crystallin family)
VAHGAQLVDDGDFEPATPPLQGDRAADHPSADHCYSHAPDLDPNFTPQQEPPMKNRTIRILSAEDVERVLSMPDAIRAVREAFLQLSSGQATVPLRTSMAFGDRDGGALFMPVHLPEFEQIGLKAVSVFPENPEEGLPVIQAVFLIMDGSDGRPLAMMDGEFLTALRTGAASGLATDLLARREASAVAVIGAGVQGRTQLEAVCSVRSIERAVVVDLDGARAEAFAREMSDRLAIPVVAGNVERALSDCDVLCTATPATHPVFPDQLLSPGVHINAVGSYKPEMCEIPQETVVRARVVVDSRPACSTEAGDLIQPIQAGLIDESHIHAEIGEIAAGTAEARASEEQITLFKSVGNAVQDLSAASRALDRAVQLGLGIEVPL